MTRLPVLLAVLLCATLTRAAAAQAVWFVDPPGSGPLTLAQAAIDGAADGDVIVLRGVWAGNMTIDGKGLVVVSSAPSTANTVRVRNLPAGSTFALRGVDLAGFALSDNQGTILIDQCDVVGSQPLSAFRCESIVVTRSTFHCTAMCGGAAAWLTTSHLLADDSQFEGSDGLPGLNSGICIAAYGCDGDSGVIVGWQSTAWLQSCRVQGGCGGPGGVCPFGVAASGNNAPGLGVQTGSRAYVRGLVELGCAPSVGDIVRSSGPLCRLDMPDTVRPRTQAPLAFMGAALGDAYLLAASRITGRFVGAEPGWFHSSPTLAGGRTRLGTCDPQGALAAPVLTPYLDPAAVVPYFAQGVSVLPGAATLFAPVRLVLVAGDQSGL